MIQGLIGIGLVVAAASARRPPAHVRDIRFAVKSLMEELDAIRDYTRRIAASSDADLAKRLHHARSEEAQHAQLLVEWLAANAPEIVVRLKKIQ